MQAYPNPASEMLYLTLPMAIEEATLEVIDPQGKLVVQHTLAQSNVLHELDVRSWTAGIYMVRLLSKGVHMDSQRITILR
ncbi:MAG: T9SS type A sorting domain-containing protein [Flavobacteriales bacterium]|nr:T9SS type A sorting domain-containing protein [Flavobacteriales bacterium]MCB0784375.1 T9SS type A sorting domain-containing protein [Flavobacteriales bacterium]MCB0789038.1 T9SS type A sorting domain-containing protein [Flavobacteriales bacterium]MCB0808869.1 T9SS type A sorting domain-containing protein [Flavobacteriales bacterium]MCB0813854.1 T9SS type A sorting domain-containing protein [Flavobacteriales bacterium]